MNTNTQQGTVTFKKPNASLSAEEVEEADYVNAAVRTVDNKPVTLDKKSPSFTQSVPTIAVSWVVLLVIVGLHIYFTSVISENNNKLNEEILNLTTQNRNLTTRNQELETQNQELETRNLNLTNISNMLVSDNENLRKDNKNLTVHFDNLTPVYAVLGKKITELTTQNVNLTTRNQELEKERNNLTQEIQNIQTEWNELNVSRAQWSIDAYCPKNTGRQCTACQDGWEKDQSSCYAINDPEPPGQSNWEGARENCRGKISDLAVVVNDQEKTYISNNIWGSIGFWIGLRAEDGRWKWVDGRNLTESSWIQEPADNGQCVISVYNQGWKSVSCSDRNRWICGKAALSV